MRSFERSGYQNATIFEIIEFFNAQSSPWLPVCYARKSPTAPVRTSNSKGFIAVKQDGKIKPYPGL